MISICSVILDGMEDYARVFLHSISKHCKDVKEVIFVKVTGEQEGLLEEKEIDTLSVKMFGFPITKSVIHPIRQAWLLNVCGHALGLHHAIEKSTQEYVWLSDPDIFFLGPTDRIYLNCLEKLNLSIVGVAHFNPKEQCYLNFPCITNCMIKKDNLPPSDWLEDMIYLRSDMRSDNYVKMLRLDGKYLMPGRIEERKEEFPNQTGYFDAGCNLWLWNKDRRWLWLSFHLDHQTEFNAENYGFRELIYPMNYNAKNYNANFDVEIQDTTELLYHRTRGTREDGIQFRQLYENVIGNQI